jgi:hypothetical protein
MGFSGSKTRFLNSIICSIFFSNKKSNSKKILKKLSFFKNNYWRTIPNEFDKFKINIYSQSRSLPYLLLNSQNESKPRSDLYNWKKISRNLQFLYLLYHLLFYYFLFHRLLFHRLLDFHDRPAVKLKRKIYGN